MHENEYKFTINNNSYAVEIRSIENEQAVVLVNGEEIVVDIESLPLLPSSNVVIISPGAKVGPVLPMGVGMQIANVAGEDRSTKTGATYAAPAKKKSTLLMRNAAANLHSSESTRPTSGIKKEMKNPVRAPLPGMVLNIKVKVEDSVNSGDVILIMEAMKMENEIRAHTTGTITSVFVESGQSVGEGDPLVDIG